jgi:tetratricopeptide (TPR) repeat protein
VRATGNTAGEIIVLNNIGAIHEDLGDAQQALTYYNRALPLAMEAGDQLRESVTRFNIAMIHVNMGELDKAEEQMVKVVALDEALGHPDLEDDSRLLEQIRALRAQEE